MKSDQFLVSVIIPVHNGEAFLAEAVESIQQQNYHPLKITIVDDGSTDFRSEELLKEAGSISFKLCNLVCAIPLTCYQLRDASAISQFA